MLSLQVASVWYSGQLLGFHDVLIEGGPCSEWNPETLATRGTARKAESLGDARHVQLLFCEAADSGAVSNTDEELVLEIS